MECETIAYKPIEGYEDYLIFANGSVYSTKSQKMLKPQKMWKGYLYVDLYKDGVMKCCRLHRIIADAFLPNPLNKPEVNHIDGDKTNNNVSNLEWVTSSENKLHASRVGLRTKFGDQKSVNQYTKDGDYITTYPSAHEAARHTGLSYGNISDVCRGERKSAGGYIWRFTDQ